MAGQAAQSILFTAKVIVRSAAIAADEATMPAAIAAPARNLGLFMAMLRSRVEKEWCDEVEAERGGNEDRREDEACLDDAIRQRARAGLAVRAGASRGPMHQPIAVTEKRERRGNEPGLIGSKPGEIPDPCPADPEGEQNKGQNATRRRRERAENAARRHQNLTQPVVGNLIVFVGRHGL